MRQAGHRKIRISKSDIANAIPRDSKHCMIADSIQRAYPWATHISVDRQSIRFSNPKTGKRFVYLTSPFASEQLVKFDQGEPIKPFDVSMTSGYSGTMRSRQPGFKRSKKRYAKNRKNSKRRPMPTRYREFGARLLSS